MDVATLLIGVGAVAVMVAPIFWIQISNKRKSAARIKGMIKQAQALGANISKHDVFEDQFIGIEG